MLRFLFTSIRIENVESDRIRLLHYLLYYLSNPGISSDLAEVINPQNIKEAKESIAKSIYQHTNKPTTYIPPSHEMQKPTLAYDPTTIRQNPQGSSLKPCIILIL